MSAFKTKTVSDTKIKVIKNIDNEITAKGADWFPIVYSNIFELAKKFSGKTTIAENILQHCAGKNTKFIFIVSTINKDPTWKRIVKYWENKGNDVITYDDLYYYTDDDERVNVIQEFINEQKSLAEDELDEENKYTEQKGSGIIKTHNPQIIKTDNKRSILNYLQVGKGQPEVIEEPKKEPKKEEPSNIEKSKKQKVIYPEYIIVIDDLGAGMRDKSITQLLKTNRHYKTKVILSGQNLNDLEPAAIRQIDYCLVFGRIPEEKLEKLREDLNLTIAKEQFLEIYRDATDKPYQFLYIGRSPKGDIFRKSFNQEYILDS